VNGSFCAISSGHVAPVRRTSAMLTIVCPEEQTKNGSRSPEARCTNTRMRDLMLTNQEPDWNIDDLTEAQINAAIRYLEAAETSTEARNREEQNREKESREEQNDDNGVVISVCLYIAMSVCLAFLWLYWK